MFARLINTIVSGFYKTKWTHHLQPKHPDRTLQKPIAHWRIFCGDIVKMRTGNDKGKVGKVVKVFRKTNRVVVSGINKHFKTKCKSSVTQQHPRAKIEESKGLHQFMYPTSVSTTSKPENLSE